MNRWIGEDHKCLSSRLSPLFHFSPEAARQPALMKPFHFFFLSFFLGIFLSRFLSLGLSFRYGNKVPLERLTGFHRLIGFNQAAVAFSFRLQPVSEPIGFPIPLASKRPYLIFTINDLHIPLYVVRKNTETLFNETGQTCADFLEPCDVSFQ